MPHARNSEVQTVRVSVDRSRQETEGMSGLQNAGMEQGTKEMITTQEERFWYKITKHTATPWHVDQNRIDPGTDIRCQDGTMLAQVCGHGKHADEKPANAEFIVRACNSYADMLVALRDLLAACDELTLSDGRSDGVCERARRAIAKATEGTVNG